MLDPSAGQQGFMNQQAAAAAAASGHFSNPFSQQYQGGGGGVFGGGGQHAKSFSLPVSFDPQQHILPPPSERACNLNGDVPLPTGWVSEKAPNGQTYYYNQMTKQSSWEDPRKMYNLPMYQNEINYDLRAHIYKTIPLPNGWQEARTETGKAYYINHNTRMTHWEDPRIEIYMQQEQHKYHQNQQQFGMAAQQPAVAQGFGQPVMSAQPAPAAAAYLPGAFNMTGGYHTYPHQQNPGSAVKNQHLASAAASRMSPMLKSPASMPAMSHGSPSLTSLSHSSSSSSLSSSQELLSTSSCSSSTSSSLSSSKPLATNFSNMPNHQYVQSLRRSLDKVLENKQSICTQLSELAEQENMLKAKMRPQDIDEVMKLVLKEAKLSAKPAFAGLEAQVMPPAAVTTHNTTDPSIEMDQLDSTLVVADTSANTSNVIND